MKILKKGYRNGSLNQHAVVLEGYKLSIYSLEAGKYTELLSSTDSPYMRQCFLDQLN